MMKFVFVALLFVLAVSGEDTIKYAGTTSGSATWTTPTINSNNVCSNSTTSGAAYVYFNVTFATAGVREVAAMAEQSFKTYMRLFVYQGGFDASRPCANLVTIIDENRFGSSGGGPVLDDFIHFAAQTYYFVASSSYSGTNGIFAVNIYPSDVTGQLTPLSPVWALPSIEYDYYGNLTCSSDNYYEAHYGSYTWNQTNTGYFDIYAIFSNTTEDYIYSHIVLYKGVPAASIVNDSCNATTLGATLLAGRSSSYPGLFLPYLELVAGQVYTVVFSNRDLQSFAYWGVKIIPTRIRFQSSVDWTQPSRSDTGCTASSNTAASWDATMFTTEYRAYLIDTGDAPEPFQYFDSYSFMYRGSNTVGLTSGSSPYTCPIFAPLVSRGDTGDVTPVFALTDVGVNYTVVVSTYGGGDYGPNNSNGYVYAYVLYLFTGQPIGVLPATTTGAIASTTTAKAATTGGATTAKAATTGGATTAKAATTGGATTAKAATTGGATTSKVSTTGGSTTAKISTTGGATTQRMSTTGVTGLATTESRTTANSGLPVSTTSSATSVYVSVAVLAFVAFFMTL